MTPAEPFFTATNLDDLSVTSATLDHAGVTIAQDDYRLHLPLHIAVDIAAETILQLLEEGDITNRSGLSLREWLGNADADKLYALLSRISGPDGPTFTTPHRR